MTLKYFFRPYLAPTVRRILLVESGSRHLLEKLIPSLRRVYGDDTAFDLCTCFPGAPVELNEASRIYRTADYNSPAARKRLYLELRANGYDAMGILCSGEPIMTKWKWALVFEVGAHAFLINENADFVWFDQEHWKGLAAYAHTRLGFDDSGAVRTLVRILLLPFSLLYLSLYALTAHAMRAWRQFLS